MNLRAIVNSGRLEYALAHLSWEFSPYFYAGLRRAAAAYRREFVGTLQTRLKNAAGFKKGQKQEQRFPWGFFWHAQPKEEKKPVHLEDIRVDISTTSTVAKVLEEGATIRPRNKRMLSIPIARALTRTGRPKKAFRSPAEAEKRGYDVVAKWRPRGEYLLGIRESYGRGGKRSRFRLMWRLVHKVHIKARLGFFDGWDRFQPEAQRRMDEEADRFWRKYFGQRPIRRAG